MFKCFYSKPARIEAYQLTKELIDAAILDDAPLPGIEFGARSYHKGERRVWSHTQYVTTIQGQRVPVHPGEWIVKERDGEHHYPVADDVFRAKYEKALDE